MLKEEEEVRTHYTKLPIKKKKKPITLNYMGQTNKKRYQLIYMK